jgi:hypothetical protein
VLFATAIRIHYNSEVLKHFISASFCYPTVRAPLAQFLSVEINSLLMQYSLLEPLAVIDIQQDRNK